MNVRGLLALWAVLWTLCAHGATFLVTTTADETNAADGLLSLREAVIAANTNADPDTILLPAGTYSFSLAGQDEDASRTGDLDIRTAVNILGTNAATTIIDAADLDRVCFVNSGANATFSNVTLTGGQAMDGGCLWNEGNLLLASCSVDGNEAYRSGGGIEQYSGLLVVERSTISRNAGGYLGAGGIDVVGGLAIVSNSTVSGNSSDSGGGIHRYDGDVRLYHSTVASNAAGIGGGVFKWPPSGTMEAWNSIVAGNLAGTSPDIAGSVVSTGYNLIGDTAGAGGFVSSDLQDFDPQIGPLALNGGTTPTHALGPTSPAINRADPATAGPPGAPSGICRGPTRPDGAGRHESRAVFRVPREGGAAVTLFLKNHDRDCEWLCTMVDLEMGRVPPLHGGTI